MCNRADKGEIEPDFEQKLPSLLPPFLCFSTIEKCSNQGRDALIGQKLTESYLQFNWSQSRLSQLEEDNPTEYFTH